MTMERAIQERYSAASRAPETGLCCPVDYDPEYLKAIPAEVLDRDYGCGDPVSQVRPGERVLDLGSGTGKVCFIAAQIVGPAGSVLGIDLNDDMLAVARNAQPEVARRLGYSNVTFAKARIEDLALDLNFLDGHLSRHPVHSCEDLSQLEDLSARLRRDSPLVPGASIDVVISNCVLNLVTPQSKKDLFTEIARVLRPGGRAIISDIVSSIDVPAAMQADPDLWSGCYSGAMREDLFLDGFCRAGLTGLTIVKREARPWETMGDVDFRSLTIAAYKEPAPARGHAGAAIYYGPFAVAKTDRGLDLPRGQAVRIGPDDLSALSMEPYRNHLQLLELQDDAQEAPTGPSPSGKPRYRIVTEPPGLASACDC